MSTITTSLIGSTEDGRSPLEQLRLRDLQKLADKHNIPYQALSRKADLLALLQGIAQVDNLAQYFQAAGSEQSAPKLAVPSQEAIDTAREEIRGQLEAMDAVTFTAWCKENDIKITGVVPNKDNRAKIIAEYMDAI